MTNPSNLPEGKNEKNHRDLQRVMPVTVPSLLQARNKKVKKQKQMNSEEETATTAPVTLEEFRAEIGKLASKQDIRTVTDELKKANNTLEERLEILESQFEMEGERDKANSEVKRMKEENVSLHGQLEQRRKEMKILCFTPWPAGAAEEGDEDSMFHSMVSWSSGGRR
ncbi:hypothetical protein ACOMHN_054959 [Nucella lapillus]